MRGCSPSSTPAGGGTRLTFRRALAQKAFARTAVYDAGISNWFAAQIGETAPDYRGFGGRKRQTLRYGENPHQAAAFYVNEQPSFGRRHGEANSGQGAFLQQCQRHRCRARTGQRVRAFKDAGGRDHQTRQSLRRRASAKPHEAYHLALRMRSGLGLRRHHRREPHARRRDGTRDRRKSSPRSSSRPTRARRRGRSSPPSSIYACC